MESHSPSKETNDSGIKTSEEHETELELNFNLYENLLKVTNHILKKKIPERKNLPNEPLFSEPITRIDDENQTQKRTKFYFYMKNIQFKKTPTMEIFHESLDCSISLLFQKKFGTIEIYFKMGSDLYMQFYFMSYETENSSFTYSNRHELLTIYYNFLHVSTETFSCATAFEELLLLRDAFEEEEDSHPTDSEIHEIISEKN